MKKSIITVLLSISMTVGSIGAVPAFAAELVAEEAASGSAEETTEGVTVSGEAGTSSTSEAAEELEEVPDEASTSSTSEVAKEIEEVSEEASTLSTSEVAKEIEEVPDEAASAAGEVTGEVTEVSAEQKNASGSTFKPGDKMIALGKEGTTQKFPMNPKRTNGFEDYREDISDYDILVDSLNENGQSSSLEHNTVMANGKYRKLELTAAKPVNEYSWEQVLDDLNVIHYEIQGPNVKKVLRK